MDMGKIVSEIIYMESWTDNKNKKKMCCWIRKKFNF